jgi:hypothetical protein
MFMTKKSRPTNPRPTDLPSPEWLADKVLQMEQTRTPEQQSLDAPFNETPEDVRRHYARYILEVYRDAQVELRDAASGTKTPFSYEKVFTQEQLAHGVNVFEAFRMIANEKDLGRAKDRIAIWLDWEHGHDDSATNGVKVVAPRTIHGYSEPGRPHTGESWLEEAQTGWGKDRGNGMPWFVVYSLMMHFDGFDRTIRRVPWDKLYRLKKDLKKCLEDAKGKNSHKGRNAAAPGRNAPKAKGR